MMYYGGLWQGNFSNNQKNKKKPFSYDTIIE